MIAGERSILVLQHARCETPGVYEDELRDRGVPFRRVLLDAGGELPDWRDHAAVLVMGGAMGAYQEHVHPWLAPEKRLIAEAVGAGLPYWGVCLGAQMLAASLGAAVRAGPGTELGVLPVRLTEQARTDPVFGAAPRTFPTLQWHGDTYDLPPGARQLARSERYEQQAFVVDRAYGVQFHLEVDSALAARWMEVPEYVRELEQLDGPGAAGRLLGQVEAAERETVPLARGLFSRWLLDVVGVGPS